MTKVKTTFICQSCGFQSPKWMGRCPGCGEWESMVEEVEEAASVEYSFPSSQPVLYQDIQEAAKEKIRTGIEELNQVLGGGVVKGSLVLIGGEPGIGKSTLLLQVSRDFAAGGEKVLYVSGEESLEQIKLRGSRLGIGKGELYLMAETNLERIISQAETLRPRVFVLDSVQTAFSSKLTSSPGTISQVREVTNQVFRFAKKNEICAFLVGHITKEGSLAGPKTLEHMVDVVLHFEGERDRSHRVLRAMKNRFGPVSELAIFEMGSQGLLAIPNPSAFFLKERPEGAAGSVVVCTIKGSRPLLAEIQALVSSTLFAGNPRRMTVGLDHFRAAMLLAVVEKKLGFGFGGEDIHLNVAGGLTIDEPASDLGVVTAVVSCVKNRAVPADMMVLGEICLSGEVRSVSQPVARIKEAASLGFKTVVLPWGNLEQLEQEDFKGLALQGVRHLQEALDF
ncbi:MAG: DNA repair protein RadA, partial [Candidatus Aminicenantes bacterium]|nr:DNA repair protein RadA [Candidatus Aminicenantes bacterium]